MSETTRDNSEGDQDSDSSPESKMNKSLLNAMHRRRMSCPQAVQQLWDVVRVIRYQRQVPSKDRIAKSMFRLHNVTEEEVSRQLGYCVRDNLMLVTKRRSTTKGSTKSNTDQDGYKLPDGPFEVDKHDWYCYECHTGGDVICCGSCSRVYHLSCITNLPGTKNKYVCAVCKGIEEEKPLGVKPRKLNKFILLMLTKFRDRYNGLLHFAEMMHRTITIPSHGAQVDIGCEGWRTKYLIHRPVDISKMIGVAKVKGYTRLGQFAADVQTIVHNVVIFHGVHSDLADRARQMLRDTKNAITSMQSCPMCFEAANIKRTRNWFCIPCTPPHQLVYAKANDDPYWPAKVIKVEGDKYDVRFFGGLHCQATVDKSCIQPITTNPSSLQIKRTPSWSKACEELKKHQEMLKKDNTHDSSSSSSDESVHTLVSERGFLTDENSKLASSSDDESKSSAPPPKEPAPPPRGRARKPKKIVTPRAVITPPQPPPAADPVDDFALPGPSGISGDSKKKRGRPPKAKNESEPSPTRKRGRPRRKENKEEDKPPLKEEEDDDEEEDAEEDKGMILGSEDEKKKTDVKSEPEDDPSEEKTEEPQQSPTTTSTPKSPLNKKNEEELVSSSCSEPQFRTCSTQTKPDYSKKNNETILRLKHEIEELKLLHEEQLRQLQQTHLQEIAATKKKQWCHSCEQEAIYHCCWNTAYCSTDCQQIHWQREHKRSCRRKR